MESNCDQLLSLPSSADRWENKTELFLAPTRATLSLRHQVLKNIYTPTSENCKFPLQSLFIPRIYDLGLLINTPRHRLGTEANMLHEDLNAPSEGI